MDNSSTGVAGPLYNDSGGLLANGTVSVIGNKSLTNFNCREWEEAQNVVFQIANFFYACAFVIPHTFKCSILLTRTFLCAGFTMAVLWGALYVCALDILAWNTMFVIINFGHVVYCIWKFCPPYLNKEERGFYTTIFSSLKVSKRDFKLLVMNAVTKKLDVGSSFVAESNVPSEDGLCMLITGSLAAACKNVILHEIKPFEFINSLEWEVQIQNSCPPSVSQVTIFATEESSYLFWSQNFLNGLSLLNPPLYFVLHCLTGKDIGLKLYSVAENTSNLDESTRESLGIYKKPLKHELRQYSAFPESASADEINQSPKGKVRSECWQKNRLKSVVVRMEDPALAIHRMLLAGDSKPYPIVSTDLSSAVQTFMPSPPKKKPKDRERNNGPARRFLRSIRNKRRISKRVSPKQQSSFETDGLAELPPETIVNKDIPNIELKEQ
ncbi:blood vessel epicardial substance-A-like [Artemia franciscana]|uniref:POPDC1-3 domain-containing protein n=1 Tax=Artemia franciscana TaxID=6661 RepID=A0AA88L383_ARTSF|nr:hypothetical protein QYM36_009859 [Artemia franciscana]